MKLFGCTKVAEAVNSPVSMDHLEAVQIQSETFANRTKISFESWKPRPKQKLCIAVLQAMNVADLEESKCRGLDT